MGNPLFGWGRECTEMGLSKTASSQFFGATGREDIGLSNVSPLTLPPFLSFPSGRSVCRVRRFQLCMGTVLIKPSLSSAKIFGSAMTDEVNVRKGVAVSRFPTGTSSALPGRYAAVAVERPTSREGRPDARLPEQLSQYTRIP